MICVVGEGDAGRSLAPAALYRSAGEIFERVLEPHHLNLAGHRIDEARDRTAWSWGVPWVHSARLGGRSEPAADPDDWRHPYYRAPFALSGAGG